MSGKSSAILRSHLRSSISRTICSVEINSKKLKATSRANLKHSSAAASERAENSNFLQLAEASPNAGIVLSNQNLDHMKTLFDKLVDW
jgi:hypothetical protein